MKFKIAYIIFVISIILYANTRMIGSITPRHIMTVIMAVFCFRQNIVKWTDKYYSLYLVFCGLFCLSSLITGYITEFIGFVISWLIPGIIAYWATRILRDKYNAPQILVYVLLGIGLIDALTTIGQFLHIPSFVEMPDVLRVHVDKEFIEDVESGRDFLGLTIPGLFASDVSNGYFLMVFTIISFYLCKYFNIMIVIVIWLLAITSLFFVQERAAFYIGVGISLFHLFMLQKILTNKYRYLNYLFIAILLLYISPFFYEFLFSGDSRYALGMDATNRDVIYANAEGFILDNIILGGWYYCKELYKIQPHNVFYTSLIYAGVFGTIPIFCLFYSQLRMIVLKFFDAISAIDIDLYCNFIIGTAIIAYTVNSFLHNHSFVEGEVLPWLLWGSFCYSNSKR